MRRTMPAAVALCAAAFLLMFATGSASAQAPAAVIDAVDSEGNPRWEPAHVSVDTGDTVRWEFDEATTIHDVVSVSDNWQKNSGYIQPDGPAQEHTFTAPGVYTFLCTVHPGMEGSVTVVGDDPGDPLENVLVFSKTAGFRHSSIPDGIAAIQQLGTANDFEVTATEDGADFTDTNLAQYDAVVFLSTTGDVLDDEQQAAFERYIQAGGGYVGIHAAADTEYEWSWYGEMLGGYFRNHPPGTPTASVDITDADHPSTEGLPTRWTRTDEWYNYQSPVDPVVNGGGDDYSPRDSGVHVLATVDEATYDEQDGQAGDDDHPISWCSDFDGGRSWYTGMGHTSASFIDPNSTDDEQFMAHILGGLESVTGAAAADCGAPRQATPSANDFEIVTLDDDTQDPMKLDVANDGRVFYTERVTGELNVWNPANGQVTTALQLPVDSVQENGMLGVALDPSFDTNGHIYVTWTPFTPNDQTRLSRFTVEGNSIDPASEQIIFTWQAQRQQCCHSSGALAFGLDGSLYIATGDNTNPFGAPANGFAPIDERPGRGFWDAQRTSANTNDLNGKILRIRPIPGVTGVSPGEGSTYTIPDGNLFTGDEQGGGLTRPEIYAMGFRNPFTMRVDPKTGWLLVGDYGPDAGATDPDRGPQGSVEYNVVEQPGNYGWPYCVRDNVPYIDFDFATLESGDAFNCAAPVNESPNNTGLTELPPAQPATMWMGYSETDSRVPGLGPGGAPTSGPRYDFDPDLESDTKFPEYFDGHWFIGHWNQPAWIKTATLDDDGDAIAVHETPWMDTFNRPHDMKFGPDGSLYVVDWDTNFGGAGANPNSGIYRIDYVKGARRPIVQATATPDSGPVPLEVTFSSAGSIDPDGTSLTYEWNFGDGTTSTDANPTHTFEDPGTYDVLLTVTDASGATGTDTVRVTAGNTRPDVEIVIPGNGQFAAFGEPVPYEIVVTDAEDSEIDCESVTLDVQLGHDDHAHGLSRQQGCTGTLEAGVIGGHGGTQDLYTLLIASYTDEGGAGVGPLTGTDEAVLHPKRKRAEHFSSTGRAEDGATGGTPGVQTENTQDEGGGANVGFIEDGDYVAFEQVNLEDLTGLRFRVASAGLGGTIEVHLDSPDGEPIAETAVIAPTGGWQSWTNVDLALPEPPEGTHTLYLVFRNDAAGPNDSLMNLNWFQALGKGAAASESPQVSASANPNTGEAPLEVQFTGEATDPDAAAGEELTFEWDFGVAGTSDDTSTEQNPTYTYERAGTYTATFTATDPHGVHASATVEVEVTGGECPQNNVRSDEFEGDSLDTNKWSIIRPDDTRPPTVSGGSLNFPIDVGSIYGAGTSARNIIVQPLPDGDVEVTAKISTEPLTENYQQAGLRVYAGDEDWASVHMIHAGGARDFEFIYENDNNPRNEAADKVGGIPADSPHEYWVKLISDGSTLTAQYSWDGETWNDVGRPADISGWVDPQVGPTALSDNAPTFPVASFDWIRFNPDGTGGGGGGGGEDIVDGFDGSSLGADWDVLRPDQTLQVSGGTLNIPAQAGDIYGGGGNAKNLVMRPAPDGPWTATTKINFQGTMQYHQAGLMVFGDDDNFTKFGRLTTNAAGSTLAQKFEFIYENNATPRNEAADSTANLPTLPADYWLRITSDGTNITGAYSIDGSSWTPVGRPAPLPADPKIGLFSFANAGTGDPVAAFDEFILDLPGGGPSGPSFDDEFDGSELDKNRWNAIVREDDSSYEVAGGELTITTQAGDIYGGDNTNPNNFILQDAAHAGEDWTIETKLSTTVNGGWGQGGLIAYADDGNYVKWDAVADNGGTRLNRLELRSEIDEVVQGGAPADPPVPDGVTTVWLRLTKTGDQYLGEYSWDGETWAATATPVTNGMEAPDFGVFAFGPQPDGQGDTVSFEYFLLDGRDAGGDPCACVPGPGDEFDGASLDKGKWNAIVREDESQYVVEDGQLKITTVAGDIYTGGDPAPTRNFILQDAPAGDWVIETKVSGDLSGGYEQGGLLVYVDDQNYIKYDLISDDGQTVKNRIELRSEIDGAVAGGQPQVTDLDVDAAWLRLTKTGNSYAGEYSLDGETWQSIGAPVTNDLAAPKFGLFTLGVNSPGGTAVFDYFAVNGSAGCPPDDENAPPVIAEVTADPATGFAPHEVQFDVEATDADEDELTYSWDFDGDGTEDSTDEDPVHTYTEAGEYEAEVTVSDGTAERSRSVDVSVLEEDDAEARFRVLVFSKTAGFRHDSIDEGHAAIAQLGEDNDFQVDHTEDAGAFRDDVLEHYDSVVWLSTTGDVLNDEQQAAFERYIRANGGYTGIHAAADTEYQWKWYGSLVGAYFKSHPPGTPAASVDVEDADHHSTEGLPARWDRVDEWYNYKAVNFEETEDADYSPRGDVHVLATVDESTYDELDEREGDDDHPISWCQRYDGGRSWYTGMGHTAASFSEELYLQHVLGGIEVSAGAVADAECGKQDGGTGAPVVNAVASPESGPAPLRVRFTSEAYDPDGGRVQYAWDFGDTDGSSALTRNANHTYRTPGTYTAVLTVRDNEGDLTTREFEIEVGPPEVTATADPTTAAVNDRIVFRAEGSHGAGATYEWDFGDGTTAFGRAAPHRYRAPGTFDAEVRVTLPGGATATDTVSVTITNDAPTVEVGANPRSGSVPLRVHFTAAGTDANGDSLTYAWQFGDGGTATTRNAVHTYTRTGTYTATVTVSDGHGATGTATVQVQVGSGTGANQAPTVRAAADPASGTAPLNVRFSAAGADPDGDRLTYTWDFGDGGRAAGASATHRYTAAGTYTATVTVRDPAGLTGTATVEVTVGARGAQGGVRGEQSGLRVKLSRTQKVRKVLRKGLRYRVSCKSACRVTSKLRLGKRTIGKARAKRVKAGKTRTIVVRINKRLRGSFVDAMRRADVRRARATLVTKVRIAGETETIKRRVTLKR